MFFFSSKNNSYDISLKYHLVVSDTLLLVRNRTGTQTTTNLDKKQNLKISNGIFRKQKSTFYDVDVDTFGV